MSSDWASWLARWNDAGLIDAATAERIRSFEQSRSGSARLRWPVFIALTFGALMIAGGILLFVAANWEVLSPARRFGLVLALVAGFHVGGARTGERFHAMSVALHAIGTVALGAGIALSGQIFHLDEHWPGGVMLWAAGAALAWALLRQTPQLALTAILAPAWLVGEWTVATAHGEFRESSLPIAASGIFLMALTYMTAARPGRLTPERRALLWVGAVALALSAPLLAAAASESWPDSTRLSTFAAGCAVAFGLPLLLAAGLRGAEAWPNAFAALWVIALFVIRPAIGHVALYGWWVAGSIAFVAWGLRDGRTERINMGAAFFAATILTFYFSQVMDKLGRSASLVGLGVLFLGGGWALERMRRRLVEHARSGA